MRWFVLLAGVTTLGGLTACGFATLVWLAYFAGSDLTPAQTELLDTAQWLTRNCAIMLGAFFSGWVAGQVR